MIVVIDEDEMTMIRIIISNELESKHLNIFRYTDPAGWCKMCVL